MESLIELLGNKESIGEFSKSELNLLISQIEKNNEEEMSAIKDYYKLLAIMPIEFEDQIKDIIADELNHSIILSKIAEVLSKIEPSEYENFLKIRYKDKE